jgi:hypothetical protein
MMNSLIEPSTIKTNVIEITSKSLNSNEIMSVSLDFLDSSIFTKNELTNTRDANEIKMTKRAKKQKETQYRQPTKRGDDFENIFVDTNLPISEQYQSIFLSENVVPILTEPEMAQLLISPEKNVTVQIPELLIDNLQPNSSETNIEKIVTNTGDNNTSIIDGFIPIINNKNDNFNDNSNLIFEVEKLNSNSNIENESLNNNNNNNNGVLELDKVDSVDDNHKTSTFDYNQKKNSILNIINENLDQKPSNTESKVIIDKNVNSTVDVLFSKTSEKVYSDDRRFLFLPKINSQEFVTKIINEETSRKQGPKSTIGNPVIINDILNKLPLKQSNNIIVNESNQPEINNFDIKEDLFTFDFSRFSSLCAPVDPSKNLFFKFICQIVGFITKDIIPSLHDKREEIAHIVFIMSENYFTLEFINKCKPIQIILFTSMLVSKFAKNLNEVKKTNEILKLNTQETSTPHIVPLIERNVTVTTPLQQFSYDIIEDFNEGSFNNTIDNNFRSSKQKRNSKKLYF